MIISLPQDVNEIIYEFLLFSKNHKKHLCISKKITTNIINSQVVKKYKLFKERINMIKEDKIDHIKFLREDNKLLKKWNIFHLHKWYEKSVCKCVWNNGDYVDAYDYIKGWCPAIIIKSSIERQTRLENNQLTVNYIRYYDVKFLGWSDSFIEKIPITKIAPLGKYTVKPFNIYESISRDCSNNKCYWTLCKKENNKIWKMCRIIDNIIEDDCVKLLSYQGAIYKVTKKNIHNVIRHITDATAFFSIEDDNCFLKRRLFEI
jgi:hypothetical protein